MKENKTDLILNMDEKIYLAVAKESTEKLSFIYTLACLKMANNSNSYNLNATREIHTFKNKDTAEMYYATIEKIVEINSVAANYSALFVANEKMIEQFYENIK